MREGTTVSFYYGEAGEITGGILCRQKPGLLPAPELETNATANDYGQAEVKVANGVFIEGLPAINIHTYSFKPGKNVLQLAKGACLLLGFAAEEAPLRVYDAGLQDKSSRQEVDWIFE